MIDMPKRDLLNCRRQNATQSFFRVGVDVIGLALNSKAFLQKLDVFVQLGSSTPNTHITLLSCQRPIIYVGLSGTLLAN